MRSHTLPPDAACEYRLLAALLSARRRPHPLARHPGWLDQVWGDCKAKATDRTVDTHIKTLRAKLREVDPAREYISTHRGMGYCLDVQ